MKKTIAAVAACAMAVSAMATTVSAADENTKEGYSAHYDLTVKKTATSADLTFTLVNTAVTGNKLVMYIPKSVAKTIPDEVTVTAGTKTFKFNDKDSSPDYDGSATLDEVDALDKNGNLTTEFTTGTAGAVVGDGVKDLWVYTIDLSTGNGLALSKLINTTAVAENSVITVTMKGLTETVDQAALNKALVAGAGVTGNADYKAGAIACTGGATASFNGRGVVTTSDVKQPMVTVANTKSKTSEIFERLAPKYVNVPAVINDMIANYDDVIFTFNTATDNVLTDGTYAGYYVTGVPGKNSWDGDSQFKSFPQHLYNLFGDENTGYTYSGDNYAFNNLFNAALIANNKLTMNQSTVAPFKYNKTSVSFSWSDLTGGNSFVSPASAVQSLQLATSSVWYWDSMDVTGTFDEADDASTDAGIEDDGANLDDEDAAEDDTVADDDAAEDDTVADDDAADDVADDVADDDVAADDTAADDTTDANPATGNAPIALAVIPVALAAAAVVAKKRG